MNFDRLNHWLTLGANVGVLLGIVFLAFELRQNNELLQAQSEYNFFANRVSNAEVLRTSPEFGDLLAKLNSGEPLTASERIREQAHYLNLILRWQYEFSEIQAGRLAAGADYYRTWRIIFRNEGPVPYPRLQDSWPELRKTMPTDFVEFMETDIVP